MTGNQLINVTLNQKSNKVLAPATVFHLRRVSRICEIVARELGLDRTDIGEVGLAGLLHDLGKFMVPLDIIDKTGRLSLIEYNIVKIHSQIGALMVKSLGVVSEKVVNTVFSHHERWDGGGYPVGLKGEQIPLGARILSVADTFDALSYDRPYRKKMLKNEIVEELKKVAGSQLDPNIVGISIKLIDMGAFSVQPKS